MTAATDELLLRTDGATRWIALNRPASRNGLTEPFNHAIITALDEAAADRAVRVVVLTGEGGSFCSGLDLKAAMSSAQDPAGLEERMDRLFHGLIRAVRRCPKPVVALVDGAAAGFGCDLALACDIRVGTPRTKLGEIFIKRGLMPDGGGTFSLQRLVGQAKALELMMLGDLIEADEALRLGLVSKLFPVETAQAETAQLAARLAEGAPLVHAWVKRAIHAAADGSFEEALANERKGQMELLKSRDFAEGVMAWFEKRAPRFSGE